MAHEMTNEMTFGPSSEAPLNLLHVVSVLQRKRARPPPASFSHLLVLFFEVTEPLFDLPTLL